MAGRTLKNKRLVSGASHSKTGFRHRASNYLLDHKRNFSASFFRLLATPLQTLMTVLVVAIAMALPTSLYIGVDNIERLGSGIEVNARMSVFIKQGATDTQVEALQGELNGRGDVQSILFVSAREALEEFRLISGFGDVLNMLDTNPLPPSFRVVPVDSLIADQEQLQALVSWIEEQPVVDEVSMDLGWLQKLHALVAFGRQAAFGLGVTLAIGVLLVMANTIRLAIEGRRDEIVVVKLIGGTDSYVRRPFLYSGFWLGLVAGVFAWFLVMLGFVLLSGSARRLALLYQSQYEVLGPGVMEFCALCLLGVVLGLAGTWITVYGHIKTIEPE